MESELTEVTMDNTMDKEKNNTLRRSTILHIHGKYSGISLIHMNLKTKRRVTLIKTP